MTGPESTYRRIGGVPLMRVLQVTALGALCILLTGAAVKLAFWLWHPVSPKLLPPDLSSCIRIEVRCLPCSQGFPVWRDEAEKSLLTPEETRHIEMLLQYVLDGPEQIDRFARMIASGSYSGIESGQPSTKTIATVICYFNGRPRICLTAFETTLVTEDKHLFSYRIPLDIWTRIRSQVGSSNLLPKVRLRIQCARNLGYLYMGLRGFRNHVVYPSASTWCDAIVSRYREHGDTEKETIKHLVCPAVLGARCHYAMNPDCKPESHADTVLLFESNAGWNQYGGPELFTHDHHAPRGGCVLLNDGTVKFIRTEEELGQLRWK